MGFVVFQKNTKPVFQRLWVTSGGERGGGIPTVQSKQPFSAAFPLFRIILDSDRFRALAGEGWFDRTGLTYCQSRMVLDGSAQATEGRMCMCQPSCDPGKTAGERHQIAQYSHEIALLVVYL